MKGRNFFFSAFIIAENKEKEKRIFEKFRLQQHPKAERYVRRIVQLDNHILTHNPNDLSVSGDSAGNPWVLTVSTLHATESGYL